MAGRNKVEIIGYLGRDPDLRYTQGQQAVATLNIATTRKYKNRSDELVEETEWHRVVVWGKMAERCNEFLRKGSLVFVEGRLQTRSWEDKDKIKRYTTDIVAEEVQFLDRRPSDSRPHPAARGDDEASQSRTHRGVDGGRRRDEGPPDRDVPPPGDDYIPSSAGGDDIPF